MALWGLAGLLAAAHIAGAQTRSAITGTVTDSSQALLPGVTITLTSPDLVGGAQTATTNNPFLSPNNAINSVGRPGPAA